MSYLPLQNTRPIKTASCYFRFIASTQHRSADTFCIFYSEAAKHMVKMYNPASPPHKELKGKLCKPQLCELWIIPC